MNNNDNEIGLYELIDIVKNNIFSTISIIFLVMSVVLSYLYFITPTYKSEIVISLDNQQDSEFKKVLPGNLISSRQNNKLIALAKITLKSEKFLNLVLDKVDISREFFEKKGFRKIEVDSFSDIIIESSIKDIKLYKKFFKITSLDREKFLLEIDTIDYKKAHSYNKEIDNRLFKLKVNNFAVNKEIKTSYYFRTFNRESKIKELIDNMEFNVLAPNILQIVYYDSLPLQTKNIIQKIIETFIEYRVDSKNDKLKKTLFFLEKQIKEKKSNLKIEQNILNKYQDESGTLIVNSSDNILKQLGKKENILDDISMQLQSLKKFRNNINRGVISTLALKNSDIDTKTISFLIDSYHKDTKNIEELYFQKKDISSHLTSNKQINSLIEKLKNRNIELENLLMSFTREHPDTLKQQSSINIIKRKIYKTIVSNIAKLKTSRANTKRDLLNNIRTTEKNLKAMLVEIKRAIKEKKSILQSLPKKQITSEKLKKRLKLNEETYTFLLQRKTEVEILMASMITDIKILEDAYLPKKPIKPNKKLILISTLMITLFLVIFYLLVKEFLNTKVKNIKDIERETSIPIYGTIPILRESNKRVFKESIREVRSNLKFLLGRDNGCKKILISSAISGEGKTIIAYYLAKLIGYTDRKILIMDLDLTKPRMHKELEVDNKLGVSNYLTSDIGIENFIKPIQENLDFFPAGPISENSSELLMSKKFAEILERLEKKYEYIIFDSAPIGSITDTNMILEHADILLLICKINFSQKQHIANYNKMIKDKNIKASGIIVNGVNLNYEKGSTNYGYDYNYGDRK